MELYVKKIVLFIILILTLNQCSIISPDIQYSPERLNAYITDFEIVEPFTFLSDSFSVAGANFKIDGETGAVYDVRYEVFASVRYCDNGKQKSVDLTADKVLIADTLYISNKTIYVGVGAKSLTIARDADGLYRGQEWYPGVIGVRIYYRNAEKNTQISNRKSYDHIDWWCQ